MKKFPRTLFVTRDDRDEDWLTWEKKTCSETNGERVGVYILQDVAILKITTELKTGR